MDVTEAGQSRQNRDVTDTAAPQQDRCTNNLRSNSSDADHTCSNNSRLGSKMNLVYRDVPISVSASTQTSETNSARSKKKKRQTRRGSGRGRGKSMVRGRGRAARCKNCGAKKRAPRDKNYNRKRSTAARKRLRSISSDRSNERQSRKRRRVAAVYPARSKKRAGHGRKSKTKRVHRGVAPQRERRRKAARAVSRYFLAKPFMHASNNDFDRGVIPGWNVVRPKCPIISKAFIDGPQFCFLCRKKGAALSPHPAWLRCFLCGRSAHQKCAFKESRAWSAGQWDEPYFICNECVPA